MIYQMKNVVQEYEWGSSNLLSALFGIKNESAVPQAELWMGAHYRGCSIVLTESGEKRLDDLINENPKKILGNRIYNRFGELPFLLKILTVDKPLSIQVHPTKESAKKGFEKENRKGTALYARNRNYKDKNHKPELIYAFTKFKAMNGFRSIDDIISLFNLVDIKVLNDVLTHFKYDRTSKGLAVFFSEVFSLEGKALSESLRQLLDNTCIDIKHSNQFIHEAFTAVHECAEYYPHDIGLFAPLLFNTIELQPGEAMFLHAETPHAYLKGVGVEIMANSDNVLRAGFTSKHIDIHELIENVKYEAINFSSIKCAYTKNIFSKKFSVPVDDFSLECFLIDEEVSLNNNDSSEILLCLNGDMRISSSVNSQSIKAGESVFITAEVQGYNVQVEHTALFMRAFCSIND